MNYDQVIKLLTSQGKFQINLSLERIEAVTKLLGNPQDKFKIIHIAGTNGKGSVCAIIVNILKHGGYKTGLYTSPHLVNYTERIRINGNEISKADFSKYISGICTVAEKNNIDLTEFEILTAAAFKYFADNNIDYAVIETGLGGRFDATNVIKKPILSIITSISFDHTDRLGNTIEQIAAEKAGIIKENSIVIVSKDNKGYEVIKKTAQEKHSKLITVDKDIETVFENGNNYAVFNENKYPFPLLGLYQNKNLALCTEAVKHINGITENAVREGLKTLKWDARLEYKKDKNLIIDGAHNPDGALELKKSLDYYFKNQKRIFIYSSLKTKDYKQISNILFNDEDEVYFYEFNHKDKLSFDEFKQSAKQLKHLYKFNPSRLDNLMQKDCLKIVTGSLYMIGELYPKL